MMVSLAKALPALMIPLMCACEAKKGSTESENNSPSLHEAPPSRAERIAEASSDVKSILNDSNVNDVQKAKRFVLWVNENHGGAGMPFFTALQSLEGDLSQLELSHLAYWSFKSSSDVTERMAIVNKFYELKFRDNAYLRIVMDCQPEDLGVVKQAFNAMGPGSQRTYMVKGFVSRHLADDSPLEAVKWARSLPYPEEIETAEELISLWVKKNSLSPIQLTEISEIAQTEALRSAIDQLLPESDVEP